MRTTDTTVRLTYFVDVIRSASELTTCSMRGRASHGGLCHAICSPSDQFHLRWSFSQKSTSPMTRRRDASIIKIPIIWKRNLIVIHLCAHFGGLVGVVPILRRKMKISQIIINLQMQVVHTIYQVYTRCRPYILYTRYILDVGRTYYILGLYQMQAVPTIYQVHIRCRPCILYTRCILQM